MQPQYRTVADLPGFIRGKTSVGYQDPSKKPEKKGDFLTDLIPTAASILGGIGGTLIAPGIGTAIGGSLGGMLGKGIQSGVTGQEANVGDYLTEGAFGALGGIGKAGRALGAAKGVLKGGVNPESKAIAKRALRFGAPQGYKGFVGRGIDKLAEESAVKSLRPSPSQMTNFKSKTGTDLADYMRQNDLVGRNPDLVNTKLVQPLGREFNSLIAGIKGPITGRDILAATDEAMSPLTRNLFSEDRAVAQAVTQRMKGVAEIADSKGGLQPSDVNKLKASLDALTKSYKAGGVDPRKLDEAKRSADLLRSILHDADKTGRLKSTGLELSAAKEFSKIAKKQENIGRGSLPAGLIAQLAVGTGVGAAGSGIGGGNPLAGGVAGALGAYGLTRALNSPAVLGRVSRGANALAGKFAAGIPGRVHQTPLKAAASMLGAQVPLNLVRNMGEGQSASAMGGEETGASQPPLGAESNMGMGGAQSILGGGQEQAMPGQEAQGEQYSLQNAVTDMQRDPKNADYYMKLYSFISGAQETKQKSLTSAAANTITDLRKGMGTLDDLTKMVEKNYAGGVVQGTLRGMNPFDSEYRQQQAMVDTSRQIVGKAMEGGVLRKEDEEKYKKILPTMQDPPEVALAKLQYVKGILGDALMNYSSLVGGGSGSSEAVDILSAAGNNY